MLLRHSDECSKQGDHKTRVHGTGRGDDLAQWVLLNRWKGGGLTGDGGPIESEEDGTKEGGGLLVRIRLEVRIDVDGERRADGREQVRYFVRTDDERISRWC